MGKLQPYDVTLNIMSHGESEEELADLIQEALIVHAGLGVAQGSVKLTKDPTWSENAFELREQGIRALDSLIGLLRATA